ncbi:hypothetical protein BGZ94_005428 [Podila epigama]|nr:hypothetical protein BGZ94_005428 [Podila epigama]
MEDWIVHANLHEAKAKYTRSTLPLISASHHRALQLLLAAEANDVRLSTAQRLNAQTLLCHSQQQYDESYRHNSSNSTNLETQGSNGEASQRLKVVEHIQDCVQKALEVKRQGTRKFVSTLESKNNIPNYQLSLDDLTPLMCKPELSPLPAPLFFQELSDRANKLAALQAAEAAEIAASEKAAQEAAMRDTATGTRELTMRENDKVIEAMSKQVSEIGIQVDLLPPPISVPKVADLPSNVAPKLSKYGFYAEEEAEDERPEPSIPPASRPQPVSSGLDRPRKRTRAEGNNVPPTTPSFMTAKQQMEQQEQEKRRKGELVSDAGNTYLSRSNSNTNYGMNTGMTTGGAGSSLKQKLLSGKRTNFKSPLIKNTPSDSPDYKGLSHDELNDDRLKNIEPRMIETIKNEIMDSVPLVEWKDISGLEHAKETITEAVTWPLLRPDLFTGLRRPLKGLLLFGPPGTGKTMIGKCIASHSKATFFNISSSSLTSKWIGDGEKMVRALFAVARCHQPAVIFMDEIDSLLTQRSDNENEASRRIKTEFLIQFDGVGTTGEDDRLLLVGATNRPQEIDEAARRRFGKRLYIPLPEKEGRIDMVTNLLSNQGHDLTPEQIRDIGERTEGYSGSDIKGLCKEAAYGPIRSIRGSIMDIDLNALRPINHSDFLDALFQVRASVSDRDLEMYHNWDQEYGSVAKKVDKGKLVAKEK